MKDFVNAKPCAPEITAGISLPTLLISVSKPETTFLDWDINSSASGRDSKSLTPTKIPNFTLKIMCAYVS